MPTSGGDTQAAVSGSFVYVNSQAGQIRKYDKATGAEVTTGGFPISTAGSQAGLAVAGGRIFHKADQLYAYDATTGATAWSAGAGGDGTFYDSPAVAGGVVYVYGYDSKLYAFDEATGATMSGFPTADLATPNRNWSSPTVAGDKVYVGAGETQRLKVLGAAGTANAGVVLAEYPTFSADPQGFDLVSPVVSGGFVFAMLDGGGLYAFSAADTAGPGSISINSGAACTESQNVTLTIDPGSNTEMMISEDPLFAGASFEPVATSKAFTLSAGFGTKTVYIQFRDASGNLSNVFNDTIEYAASCATPTPTEGPPGDSSCSDTIDNDGDTLVDLNDPDCQQPEICDNGVDDDGDTLVDAADPDCAAPPNPTDVTDPTVDPSCNIQNVVYDTVPPFGTPNGPYNAPLSFFPTVGNSFAILTSGDFNLADDPNTSESSGANDGGASVRGDTDRDVTILRIDCLPDATANCLSLDFAFYSDEFQEYVNTQYNDAFIAELNTSDWTTAGSTITAPNNFAFDPGGNPISINAAGNTSMTAANSTGTTYDGATPLLNAKAFFTANVDLNGANPGNISIYLSIFDQGDNVYDSAAFFDDVKLTTVPTAADCPSGAAPVALLELTPQTGPNPVNTPHTVTATATLDGVPQSGVTVNFTVTGIGGSNPNPASGSCVTDANGQCTFTYTSATAGSDTIDASATIGSIASYGRPR